MFNSRVIVNNRPHFCIKLALTFTNLGVVTNYCVSKQHKVITQYKFFVHLILTTKLMCVFTNTKVLEKEVLKYRILSFTATVCIVYKNRVIKYYYLRRSHRSIDSYHQRAPSAVQRPPAPPLVDKQSKTKQIKHNTFRTFSQFHTRLAKTVSAHFLPQSTFKENFKN